EQLCDLIEHASLVTRDWMNHPSGKAAQVEAAKRLGGSKPGRGTVMLRHFGGLYFSYRQAAYLDAFLDAAHDQASPLKETLLAVAISTASELVNTVGKTFAQPIQPRDTSGQPKRHLIAKILRDRQLPSETAFSKLMTRYRSLRPSGHRHTVIRADYADALRALHGRVGLVYADPPYTREHYSRFYHVLETMCLGDEPQLSTTRIHSTGPKVSRGVYRADRHQSPFCI
ncbi:MAG: DNA adenine methylase, partial [Burkholderiales bacterium]